MVNNENRKPITVLIVDDNPDDLIFYNDLLASELLPANKYSIFQATDSIEAIDICGKHEIDVLLLDYNLPGDNGLDIMQQLQTLYGDKILPVIFLTGEPRQDDQAKAARQGAMDYIIKETTTTPDKLDRVITKVMSWTYKNSDNKLIGA